MRFCATYEQTVKVLKLDWYAKPCKLLWCEDITLKSTTLIGIENIIHAVRIFWATFTEITMLYEFHQNVWNESQKMDKLFK